MKTSRVAQACAAASLSAASMAWGCGSTDEATPKDGGVDAATVDATTDTAPSLDAGVDAAVPDDAIADATPHTRDATPRFDAGPARIVFFSSALYPATLGGLDGADAKCQARRVSRRATTA